MLTRFVELGWQASDTHPAVDNLSGVIHWQPNEGRLELDSEKTVIRPQNKAAVIFSRLSAAFDWKELSEGLRINMERFVLKHPNFLLNAEAVVDKTRSEFNRPATYACRIFSKQCPTLVDLSALKIPKNPN